MDICVNNKVYVSWEDVNKFIDVIADKYACVLPKGVYGIPRGGLVLATMLSYKMDIPLLMAPTKGCIIIDDIADSGRSLCHYTDNDTQFNKYHIITMFYHERSTVTPEYYAYRKDNKWIVFPWEMEN